MLNANWVMLLPRVLTFCYFTSMCWENSRYRMKIYIEYILAIREVNLASIMCDIPWRSTCSIQFSLEVELWCEIAFPILLTDIGDKSHIFKFAICTDFHVSRTCIYCCLNATTWAVNLYLNDVSAPSVLQCIFLSTCILGQRKNLMWNVYTEMHIRKRTQKFIIHQYCVECCTLAGLYFLHLTFRVLADTFFKFHTKIWGSKRAFLLTRN
jgi:hypothetical protein